MEARRLTASTTVGSRRLAAPLAVAAAAGAYAALVGRRDPAGGGPFLPCPVHLLTGLWCPTCGATRGLHQLLHGHAGAALGACAALVVVLPALAYGWLAWALPAAGGPALPGIDRLPRAAWIAGLAALVAYGIAHNLPIAPLTALAP